MSLPRRTLLAGGAAGVGPVVAGAIACACSRTTSCPPAPRWVFRTSRGSSTIRPRCRAAAAP